MHSIMSGDRTMSGLSLHSLSIGTHQDRGHHAQGTVSLRHRVGLNIPVIVLAGPDEPTVALHGLGHHVVDEAVFVPDARGLKRTFVLIVINGLEDVLKGAVVLLQNGVLGGHVERVLAVEGVFEAAMREGFNGLVGVKHAHGHTRTLEVVDLEGRGLTPIGRSKSHSELSGALHFEIGGLVLIGVGVAPHHDGLGPRGHQSGDVVADDGLPEHGAAEDVPDGAVGRFPHLLQAELGHAVLIRGDGGALDAHVVLLDGLRGVDGDFVVGLIAVLDAEIEGVQLHVQVGLEEFFLDEFPDDSGHFIPEDFDDGPGLDFAHFVAIRRSKCQMSHEEQHVFTAHKCSLTTWNGGGQSRVQQSAV